MKLLNISLTLVALATLGNIASEANAQNPIIGGDERTDYYYDPFNDHTYINRERVSVRESALDWDRMHVDPGSRRYVDRYFRDRQGFLVHEYGWTWTSNGRPHGKLTRRRVRHYPNPRPGCGGGGGFPGGGGGGVSIDDRETVIYSQGGNRRPGRGNNPRRGGGVTVDDKQTIIFDAGNNRNRNNRRNIKPNNRRRNNAGSNKKSRGRKPVFFGVSR